VGVNTRLIAIAFVSVFLIPTPLSQLADSKLDPGIPRHSKILFALRELQDERLKISAITFKTVRAELVEALPQLFT
jgi:hypothetical protein